jgi:alpha-mannosidase
MLPRTFLTQLIPARVAESLRRVEKQLWLPLSDNAIEVEQTQSFQAHLRSEEIPVDGFSKIGNDAFHWGPKYAQRWFRLKVPVDRGGAIRYLVWRDQAEATLYSEGTPYSGLDLAHTHCPLPAGKSDFLIEAVCIRTGIWLDGGALPLADQGSLYNVPLLVTRNDLAWSVYHDLRVLLDVLEAEFAEYQPGARKAFTDPIRHSPAAWRASPQFRRWCLQLDKAVDALDQFGLGAFGVELAELYATFPARAGELRAVLTGHAHIDLVWLWPEAVGEFKTVHTWATQIRLLEKYPEFRFGFSQPVAYKAVEKRAPLLHAKVKELVQSGQWEATGGSYVESDTQLPCGEGLLRSLRLGQEEFTALRGKPSRVFWLPDVFGYTAALPQLLVAFGITGFFTSKLSWSTVNRFPHTSFRWRGADGSAVLAHVMLLHDYNEAVDVRHLREDALHHQQAAVHPEFLVPTGYGDGGGGPTEEMCERARRMRDLAGVPRTEWGGIEDFFHRLEGVGAHLPEVVGELPLELHRGVFTTHGRLKAAFRNLERALQIQEAAHVISGRGPVPGEIWRRMVFAQFHDYVPGSSIWEVYAEGIPELERLAETALEQASHLMHGESSDESGWFNPLPLPRIWIDGKDCFELPPLAGGPRSALGKHLLLPPRASATRLGSKSVEARFDDNGALVDLMIRGVPVALRTASNCLWAYPDNPAMFEAWDIDRASLVTGIGATLLGSPIIDQQPHVAGVIFTYRIGTKSTVAVRYSLQGCEPVLRIGYEVDWQEPAMLLKAVFSTGYRGKQARFGTPFGSILRGQLPGSTAEEAQWEVPASRWMIVMDDAQSEGLTVVTEAKYGFTVRDGVVGVSLLRSALITEADLHPAIRGTDPRPRHSDLGRQTIALAIGRFSTDLPAEMQPAAQADLLFTPCLPFAGEKVEAGLLRVDDAPSLIPSWAEPLSKGRWVLRLHETLGRSGVASVRLMPGWRAAVTAMDGKDVLIPADPAMFATHTLKLPFGPYKIISILFIRSEEATTGKILPAGTATLGQAS